MPQRRLCELVYTKFIMVYFDEHPSPSDIYNHSDASFSQFTNFSIDSTGSSNFPQSSGNLSAPGMLPGLSATSLIHSGHTSQVADPVSIPRPPPIEHPAGIPFELLRNPYVARLQNDYQRSCTQLAKMTELSSKLLYEKVELLSQLESVKSGSGAWRWSNVHR
jgi:hypothetical protein